MDGFLRLGMVNQHKDLLIGDDECIGGGYGLRIVYLYDDDYHEDFNVSDELKIEYYE